MENKFLIMLVVLFSGINTYAITPQKYCESLAATSCEVLNIEVVNDSSDPKLAKALVFKYCRNRIFKAVRFKSQGSDVGDLGYLAVTNPLNSLYSVNAVLNASVCSQTYFNPSVGSTPTYNLLP